MTQLLEPIDIAVVADFETECPFHEEEHRCDSGGKNDLEGDATALGDNLDAGGADGSTVVRTVDPDIRYRSPRQEDDPDADSEADREVAIIRGDENSKIPVAFSAHHLIPAKESLKRAKALQKYIKKSGGKICCDLGYDVNGNENGVWLPGLHAVNSRGLNLWGAASPDLPDGEQVGRKVVTRKELENRTTKWTYTLLSGPRPSDASPAEVFNDRNLKWLYVKASMGYLTPKRQFHDRHADYSGHVENELMAVARYLDHLRGLGRDRKPPACGECAKRAKKDKTPPPSRLLGLLNRMSQWYRQQLVGQTSHVKYYTSSWCRSQHAAPKVRPSKKPR